jgi:hypothetical protein
MRIILKLTFVAEREGTTFSVTKHIPLSGSINLTKNLELYDAKIKNISFDDVKFIYNKNDCE